MEHYEAITEDQGHTVPALVEMYNDAVSTIRELEREIEELNAELDLWQQAYEEVSAEFYG